MRAINYHRFAKVVSLVLPWCSLVPMFMIVIFRPVNYLENSLIINVTACNTIAICIISAAIIIISLSRETCLWIYSSSLFDVISFFSYDIYIDYAFFGFTKTSNLKFDFSIRDFAWRNTFYISARRNLWRLVRSMSSRAFLFRISGYQFFPWKRDNHLQIHRPLRSLAPSTRQK